MKNSKKTSKKTEKKISKKNLLIIAAIFCGLLIIGASIAGVRTFRKRRADRTVHIAFYGLSDEMISLLKEKIPQEENIILDFDIIAEGAFDAALVKKNYDMFFAWRGQVTDSLETAAQEIPAKILSAMPSSLRNKKCLPILLDHCELTFYKKALSGTGLEIPGTYKSYKKYLEAAKGEVFSPFFCNGADDRILIDFVGALVLAEGGLSAYNKLIDELRSSEKLEEVLDVKLSESGLCLRSVLDMLKEWPKQGFTHPSWFNGRGNDLLYFAEDGQLGSFFTLLSEHRKIPYQIIKNFEANYFPPDVNANNYGLIAPSLSCMLLSDNSNAKRYLAEFFTEEAQSELSDKSNLAPVHSRAQAYDRQADDVRYWAASCAGGAVPDLYLAAFQRRPEELKEICGEIRNYVR